MRVLVVDNYDSFTFNLVQYLGELGAEPLVYRNDALSASEAESLEPDRLVISPGPGRPEEAGVCVELIGRRPAVPLLGVCLGHQALGVAFGGVVDRAPRLMHGKTSQIRHLGEGLFAGLPNPFEATRYHSLEVRADSLPEVFEPVAWSEEGTLMGMRHRGLPYWGVQFHPESVLTAAGPALIDNFLALCRQPRPAGV